MTVLDSHRSDARHPVVAARYGFPHISELRWLGADYAALLVHDLNQGLLRQDPRTLLRGVRCEANPRLTTVAADRGVLRAQDVSFSLELLLCDGLGRSWRLRGRWTYCGRDLGTPFAGVTHFWELLTAEVV
ncbi:hypothetical protein [Actinocorallia longicatena]|uniref:Uncharacterized protein n=1 Tax=Actinocorallia longicatena TaxID=111803 RepID=A0ABP6QEP6_9ACTN